MSMFYSHAYINLFLSVMLYSYLSLGFMFQLVYHYKKQGFTWRFAGDVLRKHQRSCVLTTIFGLICLPLGFCNLHKKVSLHFLFVCSCHLFGCNSRIMRFILSRFWKTLLVSSPHALKLQVNEQMMTTMLPRPLKILSSFKKYSCLLHFY
jgi:hypothetical protein